MSEKLRRSLQKTETAPTEAAFTEAQMAQIVVAESKWRTLLNDPAVREALPAVFRTLANAGVTAAEFVPIIGEAVSWTADAGKVVRRLALTFGLNLPTDLTPDVSMRVAIGSEVPDLMTGTTLPSHAIEGLMQLRADAPRIKEGIVRAREILRGELDDYIEHQPELDAALETFGVEPPLIGEEEE